MLVSKNHKSLHFFSLVFSKNLQIRSGFDLCHRNSFIESVRHISVDETEVMSIDRNLAQNPLKAHFGPIDITSVWSTDICLTDSIKLFRWHKSYPDRICKFLEKTREKKNEGICDFWTQTFFWIFRPLFPIEAQCFASLAAKRGGCLSGHCPLGWAST